MTAATFTDKPASPVPASYLVEEGSTLRSWLLTHDHKRIAILYAVSITLFFVVGGAAATLIRFNLVTPQGMFQPETYNRLFSIHGIVMVWFFLIPSIPNTLGNFLLPLMIGAKDLAFPRINLLSWYLFVAAGLLALFAVIAGGVDTGWTFYTPFSTMYSNSYVILAISAVFVSGFSSILTGLNFIVTVHKMRAPGMTWYRLPIFVWSNYSTAVIMVLATPVLAITLALLAVERLLRVGIFDPALGGDPLLFQHLFWFYSHPAVYIMILPSFGVISEIVTCFARRQIFGYSFMVYAILWISVIGFLVWGHHMFVSGQSLYASLVFSFLSFVIAVPSAIKVFNWTFTLYRGEIVFESPMLYAIGFIGLFTIGGLTGLFTQMKKKFGDTTGYELTIYPDYAILERPDPGEPRRVLRYDYRGGWDDPDTTSVSSDERVVDLGKFNFEKITGILHGAPETLGIKRNEINTVYLIFKASKDTTAPPDTVAISIYVSGKFNNSGYIELDPEGNTKRINYPS